jgi:hypothetical protein
LRDLPSDGSYRSASITGGGVYPLFLVAEHGFSLACSWPASQSYAARLNDAFTFCDDPEAGLKPRIVAVFHEG